MPHQINSSLITELHKKCIINWKAYEITYSHTGFYKLVEENHAFNYQLWHAEDRARRDDMGFEFVFLAKREIDSFNQKRNNKMESMDEWLYEELKPASASLCMVNSESPGMIIDRLSILSLKSYHMALQTKRHEVDEIHRKTCADKLAIIHSQLEQLSLCLEQLFNDVLTKNRTFRVYHQFKMYNDPNLNPELY